MNVILIQPNYRTKNDAQIWGIAPPMGIAYLAAVLEKNNIAVEILDANAAGLGVDETVAYVKARGVDMVGISILTPVHQFAVDVARALSGSVKLVAGGAHASSVPEELLGQGFDIVVRGEGEGPFLELARGNDAAMVAAVSFKRGDTVVHNPLGAFPGPDQIPYPARHRLINDGCRLPYRSEGTRFFPWAQIVSSRGCPWDCCFCNKSVSGHRFRMRSCDNVLGEIEELVTRYHVREINFSDDAFNCDMERAEKILDGIIKARFRLCIRFSNGLRADRINEGLLRKMKQAGTAYIAYGIESADEAVLARIPKQIRLDEVRTAVLLTKKYGIEVAGFFMFGLLGDTAASMEKTIAFAKSLALDVALFNIAIPYPGTKMYEHIRGHGRFLVDKWADFYHTSGRMIYELEGMAHPSEVEAMYRRANREFYFRPGYVGRKILSGILHGNLAMLYKGARRVLYSQK